MAGARRQRGPQRREGRIQLGLASIIRAQEKHGRGQPGGLSRPPRSRLAVLASEFPSGGSSWTRIAASRSLAATSDTLDAVALGRPHRPSPRSLPAALGCKSA